MNVAPDHTTSRGPGGIISQNGSSTRRCTFSSGDSQSIPSPNMKDSGMGPYFSANSARILSDASLIPFLLPESGPVRQPASFLLEALQERNHHHGHPSVSVFSLLSTRTAASH